MNIFGTMPSPARGEYLTDMDRDTACRYLRDHADGLLGHDDFEVHSFIAVDVNGQWIFYDGSTDRLSLWSGDNAPEHGWYYLPGNEMALTMGGMTWWEAIRRGEETESLLAAINNGCVNSST